MAPTDLLAAADIVRNAQSLPTRRQGAVLPARPDDNSSLVPGWSVFEAQARSIRVDALRWPRSVQTYEDMTRDPQIQGLLMSVFLPIRHMQWYLDPNGAPDSLVQEISEDFGLALQGEDTPEDGQGLDHDEHLRLALLALAAGHKFFEESGVITGNGPDAKYRLTRLDEYPNEGLQRIDVTDGGDLKSIRVYAADPVVDGPFVDIEADHLLSYVWDRRGADWAGRPLLYGLYRAWLLKDELIRGDATMHRRFSGLPVVESTIPDISEGTHNAAAAMAMRVRSGDTAGISMPYGTTLKLLGINGTLPDAIKSVEYHDKQMARAFMQMFAELGNTKTGSRALGATLLDHYALGVLAVAKWIRKSQMQLVNRIAVRNYGLGVQLPLIQCRQDDNEDLPIDQLVNAIDSGLIIVDDDLEAQIRERGNLVPRNPAEPGRTPPKSAAPAVARRPTAAAGTPSPAVESHTDFTGLQATYTQAVDELKTQWADVQASTIDQLVTAIGQAVTLAEVAGLTAPVVTGAILVKTLTDLVEHGAQSVVDSATAQGATLALPNLGDAKALVTSAADATSTLLASSLAQSAASHAVGMWGSVPDPAKVAASTRDHLEGLTGSTIDYELAGLATRAQNEGRFTALDQAPEGTQFYASELNDTHTCELCIAEDDTEFTSMAEARRDYPAGGFLGCLGGKRCRGTVVAIFPETPGQA